MYCMNVVFTQLIFAFRNISTFFSLITMRCLIISPHQTLQVKLQHVCQLCFQGFSHLYLAFLWISSWLVLSLLHHLRQPTQPWVCQSSSGVVTKPRQKLCQPVVIRTFSKLSGSRDRKFPLVSSSASPNNSDPPSCEIGLSNKTIILHIITRTNSNHS